MATKVRSTTFTNSLRTLLIPNNTSLRQRYKNELKDRNLNLPTWLLAMYMISVGSCIEISYNSLFATTTEPDQPSCYAPYEADSSTLKHIVPTLRSITLVVSYPLMGWLADTKIGRSQTITLSLWSCWFGTALQVTSYCIQYGTCGLPANIAKYGLTSVAFLLITIGVAGMLANVLAYGMEHLIEAPTSKVRAFVHWTLWGLFVGFLNGYVAFVEESVRNVTLLMVTAFVTLFVISCTVIVHTCLHHKFIHGDKQKGNPYSMMLSVLAYALRHKTPENRSAFTYWEEETPGRLDLGKEKYGGPFREVDVQDVKAALKVIVMIFSLFGFYISFNAIYQSFPLINKLEGSQSAYGYASYILWDVFDEVLIVLVPVFELILIPLLPKIEYFLLNPLRGIGVAYLLLLTSLVTMFLIDSLGEIKTVNERNATIPCYLNSDYDHDDTLNLSFYYYIIPLFFAGLASALSFVYSLEFICSQAPINMSGMATGIYFSMRAIYTGIASIINVVFANVSVQGPAGLSCSFYILVIQILICIAGFAVYILVAHCYQRRIRDENYDTIAVLERNYERRFTNGELQDEASDTRQESVENTGSPEDYFKYVEEEYVIETLH